MMTFFAPSNEEDLKYQLPRSRATGKPTTQYGPTGSPTLISGKREYYRIHVEIFG